MSRPNVALTGAFLALHISGGIIGLPLVIITMVVSKQAARHPTLVNFCVTWFISSWVFTLLLYSGHIRSDNPPSGICLVQASLAAGSFPMTTVASVALAFHMIHGYTASRPWSQIGANLAVVHRMRLVGLLLAPYVAFVGFATWAAVTGARNRELVTGEGPLFYCTLNAARFRLSIPIFSLVATTITLSILISIMFEFMRKHRVDKERSATRSRKSSAQFLLRLIGFMIYSCIAQAVCALLLSDPRDYTPYMFQATLPIILFAFVGTRKEVIGVWLCCCSTRSPNRSKSRTALLRPSKPSYTSSFAGVAETTRINSDEQREYMEDVFGSPLAIPQDARLKEGVSGTVSQFPGNNDVMLFDTSDRQPVDQSAIIASQQRTIARLLDENEMMSETVKVLRDAENNYHKSQNLLVAERQKTSQLQIVAERTKLDVQSQKTLIDGLLDKNTELEAELKKHVRELQVLRAEHLKITEERHNNVGREFEWMEKYKALEAEHANTRQELKTLRDERDALFDIWSSLDSPVDWELHKPRRGTMGSRQMTLPELAKRITQRSSTPARSSQTRSLQRRTTGMSSRSQRSARLEALDRMRPKLLALSSKMEMSEKVARLEEIVREQTQIIEDLETCAEDGEFDHHKRRWRIARLQGFSPSNSTIPSAGTLADALADGSTR